MYKIGHLYLDCCPRDGLGWVEEDGCMDGQTNGKTNQSDFKTYIEKWQKIKLLVFAP